MVKTFLFIEKGGGMYEKTHQFIGNFVGVGSRYGWWISAVKVQKYLQTHKYFLKKFIFSAFLSYILGIALTFIDQYAIHVVF